MFSKSVQNGACNTTSAIRLKEQQESATSLHMPSHGYFVQGMYPHVIKTFVKSHCSTLTGRQSKKASFQMAYWDTRSEER